jgi:hypothetical protein
LRRNDGEKMVEWNDDGMMTKWRQKDGNSVIKKCVIMIW